MAFWKLVAVLIAVSITIASCLPTTEQQTVEGRGHSRNSIQAENDLMDSIYTECLRKDSVSCVKYKLFSFVDKMLNQKDSFTLTEGVTIVKTSNAEGGEGAPRSISGDESFESLIMSRMSRFLEEHTINVNLKGSDIANAVSNTGRALEEVVDTITDDESTDGAVEEGRKKKKKAQKIIGPLIAAVALKAAALVPIALGAIALVAGKALLIGKIALVISAIIGLKKLLSHQKHVTYEVVSHPHHSSSHVVSHDSGYSGGGGGGSSGYGGGDVSYSSGGSSGHGGGWGRSIDGQDLAYRAQIPTQ